VGYSEGSSWSKQYRRRWINVTPAGYQRACRQAEVAMNNASLLIGKTIDAMDGNIGSVHDLYFDDQTWSLRYLVVDTGKWLPGRKVPVAPEAIVKPWHHQPAIAVKLTREQIRASPDIDTAMPVSRVAEELLHRHYQWTPYWGSTV